MPPFRLRLFILYQAPKSRGFATACGALVNRVISVISVVLRDTTLTISVSKGELESEIVRVVSLSTTEISEIHDYISGLQGLIP